MNKLKISYAMCFLICNLTYVESQSGDRPFVFRHTVELHKWALLFLGVDCCCAIHVVSAHIWRLSLLRGLS